MHIVYVSREYPPALRMGGIAAYLKETAEALVRRGHQVTVVCAHDDTTKEVDYVDNGVRVIRLSGGDFLTSAEQRRNPLLKFREIYRFHSYRRKILKTIRSLPKVDIIEAGEYGAEAFYLRNIGTPVCIRLHTATLLDRDTVGLKKFQLSKIHNWFTGKKELKLLPEFSHITSCSKALADWTEKHVPGLSPEIKVIFNPIDLSKWQRKEIPCVENTVLYAGTVAESKGVGDLVEACAKLHEEGVPVKLSIAGKMGEYGLSLREECSRNGYTWCEFLGHISREQLQQHYAESKVSCFPSWWEALGMVVLESMAIGNVTVGSRNGGMAEVITDGKDGFLVAPHDPDELAKVLRHALDMSGDEVAAMQREALSTIQTRFSTDVIVSQLETYYSSLLP